MARLVSFFVIVTVSLLGIFAPSLYNKYFGSEKPKVEKVEVVVSEEPNFPVFQSEMAVSHEGWTAPTMFDKVLPFVIPVMSPASQELVVVESPSVPDVVTTHIREVVWLPQVVVVQTPPVEVERIVEVVKTTSVALSPSDTLVSYSGQPALESMIVQRHKAPFVVFQELTDGGIGRKVIVEFVPSGEAVTYATGVSVVSFHDPRTGEVVSTRNFGPDFSVTSKYYEEFDSRFKNILKH